MHSIPEKLYYLTDRDIGAPWGRIFFDSNDVSAAAATITPAITPAAGLGVLALSSAAALAVPGAAQTVVDVQIYIIAPPFTGTRYRLRNFRSTAGAAVIDGCDWEGLILVPPGWRISAQIRFSAAAAVNQAILDVCGTMIPQGTLQLP